MMGQGEARNAVKPRRVLHPLVTRGQIWSIAAATGLFFAVALGLVLIVSHVVLSMRQTTNDIDDQRAIAAASAAVAALERRLSLIALDNAEWDEAYDAVLSERGHDWIRENWGGPSTDYPVYDGVVVFGRDLSMMSAYLKGAAFAPPGGADRTMVEYAISAQRSDAAVAGLMRVGDEIAAAAAMTIRPFSAPAPEGPGPVLILFKIVDASILSIMSNDYQIAGLTLGEERAPDSLNLALEDGSGQVLGYLSWPSRKPGDQAFDDHRSLLALAGATLVVFLAMVLAAGLLESLRLRRIATAAEYEAKRDRLTGTLNRSGFLDMLDTLAAGASPVRPLTLHMLDLDGFKQVNDTWGHAVGDMLIAAVAVRLAGFGGHFVATGRLGGDEFALAQTQMPVQVPERKPAQALTETDAETQPMPPEMLAQRVVDAFARPFTVGSRELRVTASMGHASITEPIDPAELMRRADVAMYRAKAAGKFRALEYHPQMEQTCQPPPC